MTGWHKNVFTTVVNGSQKNSKWMAKKWPTMRHNIAMEGAITKTFVLPIKLCYLLWCFFLAVPTGLQQPAPHLRSIMDQNIWIKVVEWAQSNILTWYFAIMQVLSLTGNVTHWMFSHTSLTTVTCETLATQSVPPTKKGLLASPHAT